MINVTPVLGNESPCTLALVPPQSCALTYGKIGPSIDTAVRMPIRHSRITSDTRTYEKWERRGIKTEQKSRTILDALSPFLSLKINPAVMRFYIFIFLQPPFSNSYSFAFAKKQVPPFPPQPPNPPTPPLTLLFIPPL